MKKFNKKKIGIIIIILLILIGIFSLISLQGKKERDEALKVANSFIEDFQTVPYKLKLDYYDYGKSTGEVFSIEYDGEEYNLKFMSPSKSGYETANATCIKGLKDPDCEVVKNNETRETNNIKSAFDNSYRQKISSDDKYFYSSGTNKEGYLYEANLAKDGKSVKAEYGIDQKNGVAITIDLNN